MPSLALDDNALARQAGAIASTPVGPPAPSSVPPQTAAPAGGIDDNALARQAGAIASTPIATASAAAPPTAPHAQNDWGPAITRARQDSWMPQGISDDGLLHYISGQEPHLAATIAHAQASGISSTDILNQLRDTGMIGGAAPVPSVGEKTVTPTLYGKAVTFAQHFDSAVNNNVNPVQILWNDFLQRQKLGDQAGKDWKAGDYGAAAVHGLDSIVPVLGPTINSIGDNSEALSHQADKDFAAKNYGAGALHLLDAGVPILGPMINDASDAIASGDPAKLGTVAGNVVSLKAAPEALDLAGKGLGAVGDAAKAAVSKLPKVKVQLDPAEASAVAYGHEQGVQMPVSVETGSKVAANVENVLQNMPLAASVAKKARATEQSTLAAAGAREVDALGPQPGSNTEPATPLDAGEAIHAQLDNTIAGHNKAAGDAYDLLRSIEAQPEFKSTVQTGTKMVDSGAVDEMGNPTYKRVPVMEDMQLPVPLKPVKMALQPIYDRMMRQMPVAQQQASAGLKALSNIVNGPDFESASITDENLGAIKQIARDSNSPVGQGLAKMAVKQLDAAVRATVERAGPDAVAALEQGRNSTIAKYAAQGVKDSLPAEPAQLAAKLAAPGDRNVNLLRSVAEQAPEQMPALAQSVAQGLLEKVTGEAGMGKPQTALTEWSKLGPETKRILFGDRAKGLTDFFTLAKKLGENPNPSGSGSLLAMVKGAGMALTQPHIGVPLLLGGRALAKILFEPNGARNLIAAAKIPAASGVAGAALSKQILAAAGEEGGAAPATAGFAPEAANVSSSKNGNTGAAAETVRRGAEGAGVGGGAQDGGGNPLRSPDTVIPVPGGPGAGYKAAYKLRELADLRASHNGNTFAENPQYALRNDRDYTNTVNQGKVVAGSSRAEFNPALHLTDNPDAANGPVITDADGNVLGGNGRKMMLDRVYSGNPKGAAAYRDLLAQKAPQFGVDPGDVAGMKQPVLTREVPDTEFALPGASKQKAVTDFNKKGTAELTPGERAISDSRRVSTDTLDDMASRLDAKGADATVSDVLQGRAGGEVLNKLIDDGVVTRQERAAFQNEDGELTKAGRERISQLMIGRFFRDPEQLDSIAPSVRAKVERVAAPLAQVEAKGEWNLTPDVQKAVDLIDRANKAGVRNLDDFVRQDGLFGKDKYPPQAVTLAKALATAKSNPLVRAAREYAADASYASKGESLMGDAPSQADSFGAWFGKLKSGAQEDAARLMGQAKGQKVAAVDGSGKTPAGVATAAPEVGPHGPIFREYAGNWAGARDRLLSEKTGEAPGALSHKATGPIDVIYGDGKYGLSKIAERHPEVLDDLQGILDRLGELKDQRTENSIQLGNDQYHAVIRRNFKGDPKTWLLTAFERTR
jgi:hypothetical protein